MDKIFCWECRAKISRNAIICPICGAKQKENVLNKNKDDENINSTTSIKNKKNNFWNWFFSIWFFISSIVGFGTSFGFGVFFLTISFVFLPYSNNLILYIFKTNFLNKTKFKIVLISLIIFIIFPEIFSAESVFLKIVFGIIFSFLVVYMMLEIIGCIKDNRISKIFKNK